MELTVYDHNRPMAENERQALSAFLFEALESYGDPEPDIRKAIDYAFRTDGKPGGVVITLENGKELTAAVVLNRTGMEGYIPGNILVYIATHKAYRGQRLASRLMQAAIDHTEGGIALHVEPDNPARKLYERFGFTNKYLEMRFQTN